MSRNLPETRLCDVYQGEGRTYEMSAVQIIDEVVTKKAFDLTGATELTFTVRATAAAAANSIQKTLGSGVTITYAAGGLFEVVVDPADTTALSVLDYRFDVAVTTPALTRRVIAVGIFPVRDGVTDPPP